MADDETPAALPVFAFRCLNCGSLEPSDLAGEAAVPLTCPTCKAGVRWFLNTVGQPQAEFQPQNWQTLWALSDAELAPLLEQYGITRDQIVEHVPFRTIQTRGPDVTETVTHLGEPGDCDVCRVNRDGTTEHEAGKTETVTVPTWVFEHRPLAAPTTPVPGKIIERTATEAVGTKDKARA